jgi:diaminopimelate epimerase
MIPFTKLHGIGNDYIYINAIEHNLEGTDIAELSRAMSDRHFGIGSDGIILILPSEKADFRMRMFNSDGSESAMCGNGIRCFGKYVYDRGLAAKREIAVETDAGIKILDMTVRDGKVTVVRVDMGIPRLERAEIPMKGPSGNVIEEPVILSDGTVLKLTAVSMGNPHAVIFVDDAKKFNVEKYGREIENNPLFPRRTNVEFVTLAGKDEVIQRTWERGAGETLACGTGASAVCVASHLTGRTGRKIVSHLTGGDLALEWDESSGHLFMTGPAVEVFSGEWG